MHYLDFWASNSYKIILSFLRWLDLSDSAVLHVGLDCRTVTLLSSVDLLRIFVLMTNKRNIWLNNNISIIKKVEELDVGGGKYPVVNRSARAVWSWFFYVTITWHHNDEGTHLMCSIIFQLVLSVLFFSMTWPLALYPRICLASEFDLIWFQKNVIDSWRMFRRRTPVVPNE